MTEVRETTVVYVKMGGSDGSKFHTSSACAPKITRRTTSTIREAVEANRLPCSTCTNDEVRELAADLRREV